MVHHEGFSFGGDPEYILVVPDDRGGGWKHVMPARGSPVIVDSKESWISIGRDGRADTCELRVGSGLNYSGRHIQGQRFDDFKKPGTNDPYLDRMNPQDLELVFEYFRGVVRYVSEEMYRHDNNLHIYISGLPKPKSTYNSYHPEIPCGGHIHITATEARANMQEDLLYSFALNSILSWNFYLFDKTIHKRVALNQSYGDMLDCHYAPDGRGFYPAGREGSPSDLPRTRGFEYRTSSTYCAPDNKPYTDQIVRLVDEIIEYDSNEKRQVVDFCNRFLKKMTPEWQPPADNRPFPGVGYDGNVGPSPSGLIIKRNVAPFFKTQTSGVVSKMIEAREESGFGGLDWWFDLIRPLRAVQDQNPTRIYLNGRLVTDAVRRAVVYHNAEDVWSAIENVFDHTALNRETHRAGLALMDKYKIRAERITDEFMEEYIPFSTYIAYTAMEKVIREAMPRGNAVSIGGAAEWRGTFNAVLFADDDFAEIVNRMGVFEDESGEPISIEETVDGVTHGGPLTAGVWDQAGLRFKWHFRDVYRKECIKLGAFYILYQKDVFKHLGGGGR